MSKATLNLKTNQRQLDPDGIEVGVSRQAVVEVLEQHVAMLAALKNAISRADEHVGGFPEGRHPDCKKDYDMCVAAIKKAEGK